MSNQPVVQNTSPLYTVHHSARYQRQSFIREIEAETQRRLIVYYDNGNDGISQSDVAPFQELLLDCDNSCNIDLFIQSPGGDIDVAEKLVYMLRSRAGSLRVIVAERAKSAATMMALAADEILMSSTSELGPIDPQMPFLNAAGKYVYRPAGSFLDGLEAIKEEVKDNAAKGIAPELNPAYYPLLSQIDTALLDSCTKAIARSKDFAAKWLKKYMLAGDDEKASQIANSLVNVKKYSSHGMVIDWEEAQGMGIKVKHLEADDALWKKIWELFLCYEVAAAKDSYSRMFESRKISLTY